MDLPAPFAALLAGSPIDTTDAATARMDYDILVPGVPHWLYQGDTVLHLAAAMLNVKAATALLDAGPAPCVVIVVRRT